MQYDIHTLPSGIRLIHKQTDSKVAYCGIIINTGTRDEAEREHGIAHFIEHVIFKGTTKRRAYHILSRLEDVGGELDAYTTKEKTCIYATFLNEYYERSMELIGDITFNSTFPEKELIKEKEVIFDEINSYKDSPAELIFDDYEELVYPDHPIGRNILGTKKDLKRFGKKHVEKFIANNYNTDQIVFCSVGDINFKKLVKLFEKHFGHVASNPRSFKRLPVEGYSPVNKTVSKKTYQAHCVMGNVAYDIMDKRRLGLILLNNMLGGPGMNSRLNLMLREKHGYVYNVESNYSPYSDTGLFNIYFGTDKENLDKATELVYRELTKLKDTKLGTLQLHKAKRQMIGQLAISSDSHANLLFTIGKSHLLFNKVESLEEINRKIELVTAGDLQDIAMEIFDFNQFSTLIYK